MMDTCRDDHGMSGSSYAGGETNVHRLYDLYKVIRLLSEAETGSAGRLYVYRHAYIRGIGTEAEHPDSLWAEATGYGPIGVIARAGQAIHAVIAQIRKFLVQNPNVLTDAIEFDLCGFSRGAATSRHFAYVKDDRGEWVQIPLGIVGEFSQIAGWPPADGIGNSGTTVNSAGAPMEVYVRWQSLAEPQTYKWRFIVPESLRKALLKQELVKPWYGRAEMSCRSNITIVWNDGFGFQATKIQRGQAEAEPLGPYQGFSKGKCRPMHEPACKYVEERGIPYSSWDH